MFWKLCKFSLSYRTCRPLVRLTPSPATSFSQQWSVQSWTVFTSSVVSCPSDDGGSTHLWNVGRQSFYTAVHPKRQFWTSYSPPWKLEISLKLYFLCLATKVQDDSQITTADMQQNSHFGYSLETFSSPELQTRWNDPCCIYSNNMHVGH
jgi:hypothetical protein